MTSAIMSGGVCRWVIVGERPTTSDGHLQASLSVDAGEPEAAHRLVVAADDDHRPQWRIPWAPQYHM